jgi:hypothetical protein
MKENGRALARQSPADYNIRGLKLGYLEWQSAAEKIKKKGGGGADDVRKVSQKHSDLTRIDLPDHFCHQLPQSKVDTRSSTGEISSRQTISCQLSAGQDTSYGSAKFARSETTSCIRTAKFHALGEK